ncbi:DUF2730 family protein [Frigidibacter oleivorans]|uniref:DUF2730 family protein n=1 Tax=Frigidibacter oleivorans TaxID=2487129 RepID=UPI000F8F6BE6|nr:DUF2730 family protein [Frigidibacter oleivorans]
MTVLDIGPVVAWAAALSTLLSLGTALWTALTSGARKNDKRLEEAVARLDRHEMRITSVEQTLSGLPAKEDMHELRLALEGLRGDMKEVRANQASAVATGARQEAVVQRLENYLLEKAR